MIGFASDRGKPMTPARTLLTAGRSNWFPWSGQFLLALALVASTALVQAPAPALGGTGSWQTQRVIELPGLRTRTSETFLNPDASVTTILFGTPLHYRDPTGMWQPISSLLVPASDPGFSWANAANSFHSLFKQRLTADYL